jgi:hypothetical protein
MALIGDLVAPIGVCSGGENSGRFVDVKAQPRRPAQRSYDAQIGNPAAII